LSFRIYRVQASVVEHRLRAGRAVVSSAGRHDLCRYLLVIVVGDDDVRGYGEAATTPLWSGESAETARWVVDRLISPALTGRRLDHPREALALMEKAFFGNPFTKSAVDTAVWDLWARIRDLSVSEIIADRPPVDAIPVRMAISAHPPAETVTFATEHWNAGFRTLKFKTGLAGIDDVARLRAVRERLGDKPVFTIDANGAHRSVKEAVEAIEALLPFNLQLVEQPTPRGRIRMMAEVRKRVPVPILADESVFTPDDLAEALDCDAFDLLSIYPGKNGAFTHSLDMIKTAQLAGKPCIIGSNLETDLGQAPMACLAASLSAFPVGRLANDLGTGVCYERSSVTPSLVLQHGSLQVPRGAKGFGVEPVHEYASHP